MTECHSFFGRCSDPGESEKASHPWRLAIHVQERPEEEGEGGVNGGRDDVEKQNHLQGFRSLHLSD